MTDTTIATTLSGIADALADINTTANLINVSIQIPRGDIAAVNAVASDLGGKAAPYEVGDGKWHHGADIKVHGATVTVYCADGEPVEHKRERLRAELAALDARIEANGARAEVPA